MAKYSPNQIFFLTTVEKCKKNNPLTYQEWLRHKKQGKTWREFKRYKHEVIQQFPIDKK